MLFSDEKTFLLGASSEYAWQRANDPIVQDYVRHAPKLHVWGAIGAHIKSELYFFQENFNSDKYQEIFRACLVKKRLKFSQDCRKKLPQNWVFLQDNSPVHKSKTSMKFVRGLVGDRLIQHPAVSPDLCGPTSIARPRRQKKPQSRVSRTS